MFVTYIFYDTKRCCLSPQISIWFTAYEVGDLHGCSKGYVTLAPVMATLYVCMIVLLLENPWFIAGVQNSYISAYMWEYMFNEKQVSPTLPVSVGYRKHQFEILTHDISIVLLYVCIKLNLLTFNSFYEVDQ